MSVNCPKRAVSPRAAAPPASSGCITTRGSRSSSRWQPTGQHGDACTRRVRAQETGKTSRWARARRDRASTLATSAITARGGGRSSFIACRSRIPAPRYRPALNPCGSGTRMDHVTRKRCSSCPTEGCSSSRRANWARLRCIACRNCFKTARPFSSSALRPSWNPRGETPVASRGRIASLAPAPHPTAAGSYFVRCTA